MFESLIERLIVAFLSAVAATLTLAMYPLAILILGGGAGGGGEIEWGLISMLLFSGDLAF